MESPRNTSRIFIIALLLMVASVVLAASDGRIEFNGVVLVDGPTCNTSRLQITLGWNATTDDGLGVDWIGYVVRDGSNQILETGLYFIPVGENFDFTNYVSLANIHARPLRITMHDISGDGSQIGMLPLRRRVNTIRSYPQIASTEYDPATVLPQCGQLRLKN